MKFGGQPSSILKFFSFSWSSYFGIHLAIGFPWLSSKFFKFPLGWNPKLLRKTSFSPQKNSLLWQLIKVKFCSKNFLLGSWLYQQSRWSSSGIFHRLLVDLVEYLFQSSIPQKERNVSSKRENRHYCSKSATRCPSLYNLSIPLQ